MMRILLVTNIIGPYRQHLYNAWAIDCREREMEFCTAFMARGQPIRRWEPEDYPLNHPHTFYRGLHIPVPRFQRPIHMNPGIWWDMMRKNWDIVIVGGYDNITSAVAPLLPERSQLRILWCESNPVSQRHSGKLSSKLKGFFMSLYDAYIVPGEWSKEYVCMHYPAAQNRPFLLLPNVINEQEFKRYRFLSSEEIAVLRKKWQVPKGHRVLLFVGRLDPKKGFDRVIAATADRIEKPATYIIAGEGTIQGNIAEQADASKKVNIKLVGYQKEEIVRELMGMSDGFILASLYDPWPLVLVEAATVGKAILCSDKVGNCRDIVRDGWNGWIFDPMNPDSIFDAVREFFNSGSESLREMGERSAQLADEKLKTSQVIKRLNEGLLELYHDKQNGLS